MAHRFDSQKFVRRMEAAGMARGVAEELANALGPLLLGGFATRCDLSEGFERSDDRLRETATDAGLRLTLQFCAMLGGGLTLFIAIIGALIAFR